MSVLLEFDVSVRQHIAKHSLAPLAHALRAELDPLIDGALVIPDVKARLTRIGGRCANDGRLLEFDPYSPHAHRCAACGVVYTGQEHHDWWAMGAQLWTAERAVQGAALNLLTGDAEAGALSLRILGELADRYTSWPNQDNALGPTRPFFSTYLESIWLLNLCHAIALLESAAVSDAAARTLSHVRESLVLPSRDLIASYNEGRSNRQVWNEVAVLSASRLLGDTRTITQRLEARMGLHGILDTGLLSDGTWYEGENYHLFAHRGLWYGVQLLRALGRPLKHELEARYRAGFVTPFLGVLPDDTLPSRRDSQYAVSIRQWRFAEWCELGIAHARERDGGDARADSRLTGTLARLYDGSADASLSHQSRHRFSTADSERNEPAGLLSRADLSWRALLVANAELQTVRNWSPGSVCLPSQGLAVIRRDEGKLYVALEGGHTGGGHGHPDRLALTVQHGGKRFLEDPGTGSYVERKLHWYRSTLAHSAPVIDGASQDPVPAQLLAFEDRGWAGWMKKRVENMKPGVHVERTIVVCEGHLIDVLEWQADREVQIELPIGRNVHTGADRDWHPADAGGAGGLEDGFDFLEQVEADHSKPKGPAAFYAAAAAARAMQSDDEWHECGGDFTQSVYLTITDAPRRFTRSRTELQLWRALAPGAPGHVPQHLYWFRTKGTRGRIATAWLWPEAVSFGSATDSTSLSITMQDGTTAVHSPSETGWHIDLQAGAATSSIDLELLGQGSADANEDDDYARSAPGAHAERVPVVIPSSPNALSVELGEMHYLRTEQSWLEAGRPTATAHLHVHNDQLIVRVDARTGDPIVPAVDELNELDNERPDVNSDGVQLHIGPVRGQSWTAGWLAVPSPDHAPRARVTALLANTPSIAAEWKTLDAGWSMTLVIPVSLVQTAADGSFVLELIVNERPASRLRRRGQLVLSGGGGFAYLRGDRTESLQALTFRLPQR